MDADFSNDDHRGAVAEMLRTSRERKGLSQNKAFQLCDVSRLTYRMWEQGTWKQIRLRYAPVIADFCDTTEEDILETMGVMTHEAAEALRRARKRGTVKRVINTDGLTGWETGRYLQWVDEALLKSCDPGVPSSARCAAPRTIRTAGASRSRSPTASTRGPRVAGHVTRSAGTGVARARVGHTPASSCPRLPS